MKYYNKAVKPHSITKQGHVIFLLGGDLFRICDENWKPIKPTTEPFVITDYKRMNEKVLNWHGAAEKRCRSGADGYDIQIRPAVFEDFKDQTRWFSTKIQKTKNGLIAERTNGYMYDNQMYQDEKYAYQLFYEYFDDNEVLELEELKKIYDFSKFVDFFDTKKGDLTVFLKPSGYQFLIEASFANVFQILLSMQQKDLMHIAFNILFKAKVLDFAINFETGDLILQKESFIEFKKKGYDSFVDVSFKGRETRIYSSKWQELTYCSEMEFLNYFSKYEREHWARQANLLQGIFENKWDAIREEEAKKIKYESERLQRIANRDFDYDLKEVRKFYINIMQVDFLQDLATKANNEWKSGQKHEFSESWTTYDSLFWFKINEHNQLVIASLLHKDYDGSERDVACMVALIDEWTNIHSKTVVKFKNYDATRFLHAKEAYELYIENCHIPDDSEVEDYDLYVRNL